MNKAILILSMLFLIVCSNESEETKRLQKQVDKAHEATVCAECELKLMESGLSEEEASKQCNCNGK